MPELDPRPNGPAASPLTGQPAAEPLDGTHQGDPLHARAEALMQRGSALAAAAQEQLHHWQARDAQRDSLPGEHWIALGAGLWLLTRCRPSMLGQLLCVAAGAALVYRSMTGRDSPLQGRRERQQAGPATSWPSQQDAAGRVDDLLSPGEPSGRPPL